jgi:hypothetical protein
VLAFQVCACFGLALGVGINIGLGIRLNLPLMTSVFISLLGLFMIPIVAMTTKIISGEEELCFYHHLITVLAVTWMVLWLLGRPVLPFLDVLILAIGAARAFGFFGCLVAGCCHGRPSRWGILYQEHYTGILPQSLLGVRLFPIQIVESLATFGVVIVGCLVVFDQPVPGAGVAWFILTYCPLRFCFECLRWPPNYHFKSGLSQHQWVSVFLVLFIVSLEFTGVLPLHTWHEVVLVVLLLMTAVLIVERRLRSAGKQLTHPEHVRELIELASRRRETAQHGLATIPIGSTSLGLRISAGRIANEGDEVYHYALSRADGLTEATVKSLAKAIARLQSLSDPIEVVAGTSGVFHLLVHSARGQGL